MPVILDSKDLKAIDKEFAAGSQVWDLLKGGAAAVTSGFCRRKRSPHQQNERFYC